MRTSLGLRFLVHACMHAYLLQLCLILWNSMDCKTVRLFCSWDSPGKNTGVGCHSLIQGTFLTLGSNPCPLHWQAGSLDRGIWQSMGWQRVRRDWGTHTFTTTATCKALRVLRGRVKGRSSSLFSMPRFNIGHLPVDCWGYGGIFNASYLDGMDLWDLVFVRDSPIKSLTFCRPQSLLASPRGPSCLQCASLLLAWGFLTFWRLTGIFKTILLLFHCDN